MFTQSTHDTIIAVSTGWEASAMGIVRLSGDDCFSLTQSVGLQPPAIDQPLPTYTRQAVSVDNDITVPTDVFWFRGPRSYTGQNAVEIHTIGNLPLLRKLASKLIELGARRALPGEFTARAYLNGKLDAIQVDAVQSLVAADNESTARRAARASRHSHETLIRETTQRLIDLLARIEAGIDFVEEEDVSFITREEIVTTLQSLITQLCEATTTQGHLHRQGRFHVAIAGLPNAGKSTLFNALLGYERAIVAPVLGTTRDVLSAELTIDEHTFVLQDCAGLGHTPDDLELAAHLAAEKTADDADLILWIHDSQTQWSDDELAAYRRLPNSRLVIVESKVARVSQTLSAPVNAIGHIQINALEDIGLAELKSRIIHQLDAGRLSEGSTLLDERLSRTEAALRRALTAVKSDPDLVMPELIALELREGLEHLETVARGPLVEDVLGRIFTTFCVGK